MAYGIVAANDPVNKIDPSGKEFTMAGTMVSISLNQALTTIAVTGITTALLLDVPVRMYRYMTTARLYQAQATNIVPGTLGLTHWTPDYYLFASDAKNRLSMPYIPEVWISLILYRNRDMLIGPLPVKAEPDFGTPGGGQQYFTFKPIPFWSRSPMWDWFPIQ